MGSENKPGTTTKAGYFGPSAGDPNKDGVSGGFGYYQTSNTNAANTFVDKSGTVAAEHLQYQTSGDLGNASAQVNGLYATGRIRSALNVNLKEGKVDLMPLDAAAKVSVVNAQAKGKFDLGAWVLGLFGARKETPPTDTVVIDGVFSAAPEVARVTDPTLHNPLLAPGPGSPNVFVGNLPVWRTVVDTHTCPVDGSVGQVALGAPTVFVNNMMVCRAGDLVVEVPAGPDPIKKGCPTVFAGMPAPPFTMSHVEHKAGSKESTNLNVTGALEGDLLTAEAKGKVGASFDTKKGEGFIGAKGEAVAALAKGSAEGGFSIPIPFTNHAITLGAKADGYAGAVGAKGQLDFVRGKDGSKVEFGAGAALGLGGAVTFSLGFK